MAGDGAGLRAMAREMRGRAEEIRDDAVRVGEAAAAVAADDGWTGRAAEAMRSAVAEGCADLERTAGAHEAAAEALEACAAAVDDAWPVPWVPW